MNTVAASMRSGAVSRTFCKFGASCAALRPTRIDTSQKAMTTTPMMRKIKPRVVLAVLRMRLAQPRRRSHVSSASGLRTDRLRTPGTVLGHVQKNILECCRLVDVAHSFAKLLQRAEVQPSAAMQHEDVAAQVLHEGQQM